MTSKTTIKIAIAAFLLLPSITLAKTFQSCNLVGNNYETQIIDSVVCDGKDYGSLSYGANMSYGTGSQYLALSVSTNNAVWGNCIFTDEVLDN